MPALIAVTVGLGLGWLCGGRITELAHFRMWGEHAIIPCFVLQALTRGRIGGVSGVPNLAITLWTISSLLLAICLMANVRIPGCFVGAIGLLVNQLVVLANGGMPVGPSSSTGLIVLQGEQTVFGFYHQTVSSTLFNFAGDVVPFGLGRATLMMSIGDVLLMIGVCIVIAAAMLQDDSFGRTVRNPDASPVA